MKRKESKIYGWVLSLLTALSFILFACGNEHGVDSKQQMFIDIDSAIEKENIYKTEKEKRIENLKERMARSRSDEMKKEIIDELILEYEAYVSDSALYYINLNLDNPVVKLNPRYEDELKIKKADIAAHAGLFGEAGDLLSKIDKAKLDSALLENYYSAYCDLYQYQSEYATNSEYAEYHGKLREQYIDSVGMVASPNSMNYIVNLAASEARSGNFNEAEKMLSENLDKYHSGDRNYSIIASILADIYKQKGDKNNYTKYIGKSVISDIEGAIKENMAIRALATICYEDGDLERADRYLRQSFADANFYSARMRNAQSSRMLPVIGEAYTSHQKELNHSLKLLVIFISILAFGFILISIFAFQQVKKVRIVNKKTKDMLDEMSNLSQKLSELNKELSNTNEELQKSNKVKGEYGVLFMEYCSLAISSLQQYQQTLKVAATQGNLESLKKKINSTNIESKTLAEFYTKFDEAILNLYPNFVSKFNSLLVPEERMELKPNEALNTELRVFALIKIGITDSEKISRFLRCSLSTVYTYRSKMKRKALDPENFEENLTRI